MEEQVVHSFLERFGRRPDFVVQCPGRVNLIGEHIDYSGYGVLPMAVQQTIIAAVGVNKQSKTLTLHNIDKSQYPEHQQSLDNLEIDKTTPKWYNYFLCGCRGMLEHLNLVGGSFAGLDVVVGSCLPAGAGLSSSSALVCCAALCTLGANSGNEFEAFDRSAVAELCAKCERYIGTEGGGMDQAICLLADAGKAKLIEFNPLTTRDVTLPPGACFVVGHCCRTMNKAATADFNERVVECRTGARILAKTQGLDWKSLRTLGQVQRQLSKSLSEMAALVKATLHPEPYTRTEICELLGINDEELANTCLSSNTLDMARFKLHQRTLHVYEEAARVYEFAEVCAQPLKGGAGDVDSMASLRVLGDLMNQSHYSCRDLYECSCDELDELQRVAVAGGAFGSRLTGAGWGGCIVSLIHESKKAEFVDYVTKNFYDKTEERKAAIKTALFVSPPAAGTVVKRVA